MRRTGEALCIHDDALQLLHSQGGSGKCFGSLNFKKVAISPSAAPVVPLQQSERAENIATCESSCFKHHSLLALFFFYCIGLSSLRLLVQLNLCRTFGNLKCPCWQDHSCHNSLIYHLYCERRRSPSSSWSRTWEIVQKPLEDDQEGEPAWSRGGCC